MKATLLAIAAKRREFIEKVASTRADAMSRSLVAIRLSFTPSQIVVGNHLPTQIAFNFLLCDHQWTR